MVFGQQADIGAHQFRGGRREQNLRRNVRVIDGLHRRGDGLIAGLRGGRQDSLRVVRGRREFERYFALLAASQ